ncbi:MAG: hypothetical protein IPM66_03215 [Acidobacteriota bacterium]|nr:MAG: hypothetical protein IPM66_03215 [Acidobacteriota bacterium]
MTLRRWLIVPAVCIALAVICFLNLPFLLISKADPGPADGILYLSVDPYSKSDDFVADLYRRKAAPRIVIASSQISHQLYQADFTREHFIQMGIPAEAVSAFHLPINDCLGESADVLVEELQRRGWKSALVVVNPGGSRYAGWILRRHFEPAGIEALVTYSPRTYGELTDGWWRTHWKAQVMVESLIGPMLDVWYESCR